MEELSDEILYRLPEEVSETIFYTGQPKKGRSFTLQWLAFTCAEYGLTNNEIALVISYRDRQWGPKPKYSDNLPYTKWKGIIRMIERARKEYPITDKDEGRHIYSGTVDIDDNDDWLPI